MLYNGFECYFIYVSPGNVCSYYDITFFSLSYACIRRLKAILSFHTTFVNKLADAQTHTFVYLFCHSPKLRCGVIRLPDSAPACTSISPSLQLWSLLFFKLLFYYNAQRSICFIRVETFIYLLEI